MANRWFGTKLRLARIFTPQGFKIQPKGSSDSMDREERELHAEARMESMEDGRAKRFFDALKNSEPQKRIDQYNLYEEMDNYTEVRIVLDAYAEEASQTDPERGKTVWIESPDEGIAALGNDLLRRIGMEENIYPMLRDLAKHGDVFQKIYGKDGAGIEMVECVDPRCVERVETDNNILIGFLYDPEEVSGNWTEEDIEDAYLPWDFVHYRARSTNVSAFKNDGHKNINGTSLIRTTREPLKRLKGSQDMLMVYRLTNTLDRKKIKVDTGASSSELEIFRTLQRWKAAMKRLVYRNPATGDFDITWNPLGMTEDIFWPTWTGSNSDVEIIPGQPNIYDAYDIDMNLDEVFGSMRAKKEWFGFGETAEDAGRSLSFRSILFARLAELLQKYISTGISRLVQIHCALLGRTVSADMFDVCMVPPSPIELLQRLEVTQTTVDVATSMATLADYMPLDKVEWSRYVLQSLFGFSDEQVERFLLTDEIPAEEGGGLDFGGPSPMVRPSRPVMEPEPELPPEPTVTAEPLPSSVQRPKTAAGSSLLEGDKGSRMMHNVFESLRAQSIRSTKKRTYSGTTTNAEPLPGRTSEARVLRERKELIKAKFRLVEEVSGE